MARKEDVEKDKHSSRILEQLNTKTVGPPAASTGLTGDQLPETIFNVSTFDQVKNQVTLQLDNVELLNLLNTIGQVTNTQSQSGPIIGTPQLITTTGITNSLKTVFKPEAGEVWELYAASISTLDGASTMILKLYDGSTEVVIDSGNSTSGEFAAYWTNIFITSDAYLVVRTSNASSGNAIGAFAVARVR